MKKTFIISSIFLILVQSCINPNGKKKENAFIKTEKYYGKQIEKYSKKFVINKNYLKALIVLECSGNPNPPHRFEPHVYEKLKKLQSGEIQKFEFITPELMRNLPDKTIREMASSWGPFQLMGYKSVHLNTDMESLKGEDIFFYSVKWIDETYGQTVRLKKYKDAFHLHNTGKMYPDSGPPLTYDSAYVEKGLKYMKYFMEQDSIKMYGKSGIKITVKANEN